MSRLTAIQALEYVAQPFRDPGHLHGWGPAYAQAELQFIWQGSPSPIKEIMALGFERGEAVQLWNARPKTTDEEDELNAEILILRAARGLDKGEFK
jgi:hypothetical protein